MPKHLNAEKLEKKFSSVTKSKENIQNLSSWIIVHKSFHNEICLHWLEAVEKSSAAHRLTLFYVANDVLQHCRKKGAPEFRVAFAEVLEDAVLLVKEHKEKHEVLRMINIWNQRNVYANSYLSDLIEILNVPDSGTPAKVAKEEKKSPAIKDIVQSENSKKARILANFKPSTLVTCLQEYIELAKRTKHGENQLAPYEELSELKVCSLDRKVNNETKKIYHNVAKASKLIENFLKDVELEATTATEVAKLIEDAEVYYASQNEEVKRVVHAYRIFGKKLKTVKQKLNEKIVLLPKPSKVGKSPSPTLSDCELSLHSPPSVSDSVIVDTFSPMLASSPKKLNIPLVSSSVSSDSVVSDTTAKSQHSPFFSPIMASPGIRSNLDKHLQSLTNKQQQQLVSPKSSPLDKNVPLTVNDSFMSNIQSPMLASPAKDPVARDSPSPLTDPRKKKSTPTSIADQKSSDGLDVSNKEENGPQSADIGNDVSMDSSSTNSRTEKPQCTTPSAQQTFPGVNNTLTSQAANSLPSKLTQSLKMLSGILGNNSGPIQKDHGHSKTLPINTILKLLGPNLKVPEKSSPVNLVSLFQPPTESVANETDNLVPMDMDLDSDNES